MGPALPLLGRRRPPGQLRRHRRRGGRARRQDALVVAAASHQPPANPQAYADFVGPLAKRWKGRLEAIEIWNEQDETPVLDRRARSPSAYVDLLQRSYTAIKAADPHVKVVFGPTVGNNYGFLEQAYAAGAKGYFDVMAAHTDTACLVNSPMDYYRDPGGHRIGRFVFLGYRELRATMLANGDDKPIWLTEIGWSAAQHTCETGMWAGQKLAGVDRGRSRPSSCARRTTASPRTRTSRSPCGSTTATSSPTGR